MIERLPAEPYRFPLVSQREAVRLSMIGRPDQLSRTDIGAAFWVLFFGFVFFSTFTQVE